MTPKRRDVGSGHALIPEQLEGLPLILGEGLDPLVKLGPGGQSDRFVSGVDRVGSREGRIPAGSRTTDYAAVVAIRPERSLVMPGQVDELAADLAGGQAEEVAYRLRRALFQGPAEPDQRGLPDVTGLLPPCHARKVAEHAPRQAVEPLEGAGDQAVTGLCLPRPESSHPSPQLIR